MAGQELKPGGQARRAVQLVPATAAHRFLIRRWLGLPDVVAWLGSQAAGEASVTLAGETASAIQRMIEVDGVVVGYAHALDEGIAEGTFALKRASVDSAGEVAVPAGTWMAEIFIADTGLRGFGVGRQALEQLRREVFQTTLAPALAIRVSIRHERQVRAIEAAGFSWRAVIADPVLGQTWLLVAARPD